MTLTPRIGIAIAIAISLTSCFGPKDRRPGMRLPGEVTPTPSDWSFTNDYPEIAIEVRTPYFLPHSVTIACGTLDRNLYVGARDPEHVCIQPELGQTNNVRGNGWSRHGHTSEQWFVRR